MGTYEKLVPGELLNISKLHPMKCWVKKNIKNNRRLENNGQTYKINEEITHV
jgi:hypothetical protein